MSKSLKKSYHLLHVLQSGDTKLRKAVLSSSSDHLVRAVSEICLNAIKGGLPLTDQEIKRLTPHRDLIYYLAVKKHPLKKKRRLLTQKGGFLQALLVPALTVLAGLIGDALVRDGNRS